MNPSPKLNVLDQWEDFAEMIMQRLAVGDLEYANDPAENKSTADLLREIEEEMLDIPAWSLFLWQRLQQVRANIAELERRARRLSQMTPPPINK